MTKWSSVEMSGKQAKINISGYIGIPEDWQFDEKMKDEVVSTKEKMRHELEKIANLKASKIEVNIDSFGGSVNHGLAIYNALALHKAKITVNYVGWSASAATIIGASGDVVNAPDNMMLLVHEARGFAWGKHTDLTAAAKELNIINALAAKIYSVKSGKPIDEMHSLMAENRGEGEWKTASEMKEAGLIDNVIEPFQAAASVDYNNFKQKAEKFNINSNIKMGLFSNKNKKEVINSVQLGEVQALFEGELSEGTELETIAGAELSDGSYEVEGKKVEVENNVVKSIEVLGPEMVSKTDHDAALSAKDEEITALKAEMAEKDEELSELKKLSSKHTPQKLDTIENLGEMSEEDFNIELSKKLNSKNFGRDE